MDTSSLNVEGTLPRDDDNDGGNEGDSNGKDGDNESDENYDPQHVTVPLTLCLAIMVG